MKLRLLLIILLACVTHVCDAQCTQGADVQYHFSMEDEATSTLPVPPFIGELLAKDLDIVKLENRERVSVGPPPRSWISAVKISLSRNVEGYVVIGQWPIAGANVTTFWVIINTTSGPKQVLKAAGHDLLVGPSCVRSYKTIESSYEIAGQFHKNDYAYDGHVYIQLK